MRGSAVARLEVIAGPMFAGKSEELLRRVRRSRAAGVDVVVVSHAVDTRFGAGAVSSHAGQQAESRTAADAEGILRIAGQGDPPGLLAIDEAQFFGPRLIPAIERILDRGTTVIASGLSVTFDGAPFEPMPSLMALAEDVAKLTAVCAVCGADAAFHLRVSPGARTGALTAAAEHIGGAETYQARCRRHFSAGGADRSESRERT
ncbi:thymidine kinase [Microbacterium sp. gxy059]|uniref:thymidine kinase n=1 Tax=Microbacterium sp. gxy059 TaxID=2957199 RepID=UPI003D99D5F6